MMTYTINTELKLKPGRQCISKKEKNAVQIQIKKFLS